MIFLLFSYLIIAFIVVFTGIMSLSEDVDDYLIGMILFGLPLFFLLTIPWFYFGPKYSAELNSWGGAELSADANKVLAKWILIYTIISFLTAMLIYA